MTESTDLDAHKRKQVELEDELQAAIDDHPGEKGTQEQTDKLNRAAEALAEHRAKVRTSGGPGVGGDVVIGSDQ